jgi:hypothetical protein
VQPLAWPNGGGAWQRSSGWCDTVAMEGGARKHELEVRAVAMDCGRWGKTAAAGQEGQAGGEVHGASDKSVSDSNTMRPDM